MSDGGATAVTEAVPERDVLPHVPAAKHTRSVLIWLCYGWIGLVIVLAVAAPLLPLPSYAVPIGTPRTPPHLGSLGGLLGTDGLGRSQLARVIFGARVSLVVAAAAGLAGFLIGSVTGLLAGYFGRGLDVGVALVTDVILAFPGLILLLALAAIFTPSVTTLIVGLGLMGIPPFIRLARAHTLTWSAREFVRAAKNMGGGHGRILFREILPNVLPPLGAYLPVVMSIMIVAEGSLSFLGLGIPPPTPSWGGMISDGKGNISDAPMLVFVPVLVIFCTVFSLNQVGDHLRARFDRTVRD